MKDSRTHLGYKAEHVVDLESDLVLAVNSAQADHGDTQTIVDSVLQAQLNLNEAGSQQEIQEVVADKGYHAAKTSGTYVPTWICELISQNPSIRTTHAGRVSRRSLNKPSHNNRRRTRRDKISRLQRRRSEVCERTFAHICDSGGMRRSWLRGLEDVTKRYVIAAAAKVHNLGRIMRKLFRSRQAKGPATRGGTCCGFSSLPCSGLWYSARP